LEGALAYNVVLLYAISTQALVLHQRP
jgi:hypothetical protein